jgi:hypothetical protein
LCADSLRSVDELAFDLGSVKLDMSFDEARKATPRLIEERSALILRDPSYDIALAKYIDEQKAKSEIKPML